MGDQVDAACGAHAAVRRPGYAVRVARRLEESHGERCELRAWLQGARGLRGGWQAERGKKLRERAR
eukprot:3028506-Rhodomonas_salina.2